MRAVCSFRCKGTLGGRESSLPEARWTVRPTRSWAGVFALRGLTVIALVLVGQSTAVADGILTPFAGVSFGDNQTEQVTTWGLSLAGMAGGVFGFELDFGRTGNATTDSVFTADSRVTTLMGNVIIGVPLGAIRPYVVGGLGWVRTDLEGAMAMDVQDDGLGVDVGGGLMGFFGEHVGVRVDLRYFRAVSAGGSVFDFDFENLDFIRFTGGLALRF